MPSSLLLSSLLHAVVSFGPASSPTTLTANVDDPMSHGVVGDGLRSLDEAIQLANRTLSMSALSAAEQARISGAGTAVDLIVIDAASTPTITLERPLTPIVGGGPGAGHVELIGVSTGARPVIQAGGEAWVFALRDHLIHIGELKIVGGQVAFDVRTGPSGTMTPHMALVHDCELDGQSVAGIRIHGAGMDESMLMLARTDLRNMPVGVMLDDQTSGGMVMAECEFVTMDRVTLGGDVVENGNGMMSMLMFFRSSFDHGQTLARGRRGPASGRQFMFRFVHTDARCSGDVVDIEGATNGLTMIHHHHGDFVTEPGHKAFWVHPRTAQFDVHGSEMVFDGDVSVSGNPFTMRVWQQNNVYRNGRIEYDVDGALPNLLWNRYENCTLDVPATARSPVTVRSSEFIATSVNGSALFAPVQLQACYRVGGTLSGQVTETQPAPARFLATTVIGPGAPRIGGSLQLGADAPTGTAVVWDLALGIARPTTTAEPVRIYGDPLGAIVLHGLYAFQSQINVPLPNDAALVGVEFYVQGIALSLAGQGYVPTFYLPRGARVRPQL